ncbi:hypothetical protein HanIR_Chr14g0674991 [Helianthus annuus]|nr:hypothetical protein HanIR_Chr14g0674991 [Helianthus annuus]
MGKGSMLIDIDLGHLLYFRSSRYTWSSNTWETPTNLHKHVRKTAMQIHTIHGFQNEQMIYETNAITKQPTVNSLNFVVDSLLHALQVAKCLELARGRSRCGVRTVMSRV